MQASPLSGAMRTRAVPGARSERTVRVTWRALDRVQHDHADRATVQLDHRDELHPDRTRAAEALLDELIVRLDLRPIRPSAC
eukprot:6457979-Prymnesium_polylepis.1